jgi:hypothetical protein
MFKIADLLDARAQEFGLREAMDMGMPFGTSTTRTRRSAATS